jgi:hypothetical protein
MQAALITLIEAIEATKVILTIYLVSRPTAATSIISTAMSLII